MPKISRHKLNLDVYERILRQLISAFSKFNNEKDVGELFEGLFTKTEKLMLAKRLAIAVLLEQGFTYPEISKAIKVSPVTISFVRNSVLKNHRSYNQLIKDLINQLELKPRNAAGERTLSRLEKIIENFPSKSGPGRWRFLKYL